MIIIDLTRESKNLWNFKVMFAPIVIGALGTVTKGLIKGLDDLEIRGRVETIQTTLVKDHQLTLMRKTSKE